MENEIAKYKIYLGLYTRECYFSKVTYKFVGEYTATIDGEEVKVDYSEYSKEFNIEDGIKIFDFALSNGTSTRRMLFNAKTRYAHNLKPKTLPFVGLVEYAEDDESIQYYFESSESGSEAYELTTCIFKIFEEYDINIDYDDETVTISYEDNYYESISFAGWDDEEEPKRVFTETFANDEGGNVKVTITLDATTCELSSIEFTDVSSDITDPEGDLLN